MDRDICQDLSLFALRIVIGIIFVAHGAQNLFGMFGGIGLAGTTKMMEGLSFSHPYLVATIWSAIEFLGGIFLFLGVLTRISALFISVLMIILMWKVNAAYGFFVQNGGIEYNLLIVGGCFPLIFMGGGKWSIWEV
jgi:putative oxidoreductase